MDVQDELVRRDMEKDLAFRQTGAAGSIKAVFFCFDSDMWSRQRIVSGLHSMPDRINILLNSEEHTDLKSICRTVIKQVCKELKQEINLRNEIAKDYDIELLPWLAKKLQYGNSLCKHDSYIELKLTLYFVDAEKFEGELIEGITRIFRYVVCDLS
jgi:hypothetical protein